MGDIKEFVKGKQVDLIVLCFGALWDIPPPIKKTPILIFNHEKPP